MGGYERGGRLFGSEVKMEEAIGNLAAMTMARR
jgi:hypothetical protein